MMKAAVLSYSRLKPLVACQTCIRTLNKPLEQELKLFSRLQVTRFSTDAPSDRRPSLTSDSDMVRLSKLISQHASNIPISRREAERLIRAGEVTVAGEQITAPHFILSLKDSVSSVKISGKLVKVHKDAKASATRTRVWLAHKLPGEVVSEMDPQGRPSLMDRLKRGGVGTKNEHLSPIGRLDMSTEGLILITNDGQYKRQLELPSSKVHRVYRVRVHGKLTPYKLKAIRNGIRIEDERYRGMKVQLEASRGASSTNNWIRLTCVEGKNRQIRKVLNHLGLNVTRLIRVAYGDYDLNTIPPGLAIEVPVKVLLGQKKLGRLEPKKEQLKKKVNRGEDIASPVTWVKPI